MAVQKTFPLTITPEKRASWEEEARKDGAKSFSAYIRDGMDLAIRTRRAVKKGAIPADLAKEVLNLQSNGLDMVESSESADGNSNKPEAKAEAKPEKAEAGAK